MGCGTDWGEKNGGGRDGSSTMIHHHSAQHTPPLQHARSYPLPAVWQCAQEWQGDTGSFFMCCSSMPLQSKRVQHLCITTKHQSLTGSRRGKPQLQSDINHSPVDNCCLVIFKPLVSLSTLAAAYVECKTGTCDWKAACLCAHRLGNSNE